MVVELIEVPDESFEEKQAGPSEEEDYYTDTDSEISTDDEDVADEETFGDRISALKDIVPATTRSYISNTIDSTTEWIKTGLLLGGKTLFVVSTSVLLLGVPWAVAFVEEQQVAEMEKEMKMREMGGELLSPGDTSTAGQLSAQLEAQQGKPAL